jgi:TP901 family phage tail tape measure protein
MTDTVVQGVAELSIAPFLASLQQLEASVKATVAAINTQFATLGAPLASAMGGMSGVTSSAQTELQKLNNAQNNAATVAEKSSTRRVAAEKNAAIGAKSEIGSQIKHTQALQDAIETELIRAQKNYEKDATLQSASAKKITSDKIKEQQRLQDALDSHFIAQERSLQRQEQAEATSAARQAARAKADADRLAKVNTAAALKAEESLGIFGGQRVTAAGERLKVIEDRLNSIYRAGAQISQVGMNMGFLGAAIEGIMALSIKAGAEFDGWTRKFLAAAQAAGSVTLNLDEVKAMFEQVSESTGKPADQVAEAAARFEQAVGIEIRSMKDVSGIARILEVVLQSVAITNEDVETTIVGITQILGGFGLAVNSAVDVTMALSNAAQVTNATFGNFIEAMKMSASVSRSLGLDVYEVLAVLGDLSNVGQKGTQAGRGLQMFLANLIDPSKEADAALQTILVTNQGLTGSWRDLVFVGGEFVGLIDRVNSDGQLQVGVIGQLYNATKNLTEADREQFLAKVTTQNAYRIISPLIAKYGDDVRAAEEEASTGIKSTTKSLRDLDAELRDAATRVQLFDQQWELVSQGGQVLWAQELATTMGLVRDLGMAAQLALLPLAHNINIVITGIRQWAAENRELWNGVVAATAVFGAFLVVVGGIGFMLGQTIQAFTSFRLIMVGAKDIAVILGAVFGSIGIWIAGLTAAVILLSGVWRDNWAGMKDVLQSVADSAKVVLVGLTEIVGDLINVIAGLFKGDWASAWDAFVDIIVTAIAIVDLAFKNTIAKSAVWGANFVVTFAGGMMQAASTILRSALNAIGDLIASFFEGHSPPKKGPLQGIEDWAENIVDAYGKGMEKGAKRKLEPAAKKVAETVAGPLEGHSPAKMGPLSEIDKWGPNLLSAMFEGWKKADFSVLNEVASSAVSYLKEALSSKKISPSQYLGGVGDVKSALVEMVSAIRQGGDAAEAAFNRVRAVVSGISEDIRAVVTAYAEVARAQGELDSAKGKGSELEAAKAGSYDAPMKALKEQNQDLEAKKWKWEDLITSIEEARDVLEGQKNVLEAQLAPIQESIDLIKERQETAREDVDIAQENLDKVKDIHDAERESARDKITSLRDQLDLIKDQNEARLQPMSDAAEKAADALSSKKKKDGAEEETLQRRIQNLRDRGAASYYIDKLEAQLHKIQNQNEDEQGILEEQKSAADEALELERKKVQIQEGLLEKQIKERERSEAAVEKQRKGEEAPLQARLKVVQDTAKNLATELRNKQHDTDNITKQLDNIQRMEGFLGRQESAYQFELNKINREEANLKRREDVLALENRPLLNAIEANKAEQETIQKRLDAAQNDYDVAKAIMDLHDKERADQKLPEGSGGWEPGDPADGESVAKKLQGELEGLRKRVKEIFSGIADELEEEKKKIRKQIEEMFAFPDLNWSSAAKKVNDEIWHNVLYPAKNAFVDWCDNDFHPAWVKFWGTDLPKGIGENSDNFANETVKFLNRVFGSGDYKGEGLINNWMREFDKNWGIFWKTTLPKFIEDSGPVFGTAADNVGKALKKGMVGETGKEGAIGGLIEAVKDGIGRNEEQGLRGWWNDAWLNIKNVVVGYDGEKGLLGSLRNSVKSVLSGKGGLAELFTKAFDDIKSIINGIKQPLEDAKGWFGGLIEKARAWVGVAEDPKIAGEAADARAGRTRHSGGWITEDGIHNLQKDEFVLNRSDTKRLTDMFGPMWPNMIGGGLGMTMAVDSAVSKAMPPSAPAPTVVNLHIGTLVADDRGLNELERRLKQFRDVRLSRIG